MTKRAKKANPTYLYIAKKFFLIGSFLDGKIPSVCPYRDGRTDGQKNIS